MENDDPFLNTRNAAAYLGMGTRWLEYLRTTDRGPRFRTFGKHIRYRKSDLEAYADEVMVGTSEHAA